MTETMNMNPETMNETHLLQIKRMHATLPTPTLRDLWQNLDTDPVVREACSQLLDERYFGEDRNGTRVHETTETTETMNMNPDSILTEGGEGFYFVNEALLRATREEQENLLLNATESKRLDAYTLNEEVSKETLEEAFNTLEEYCEVLGDPDFEGLLSKVYLELREFEDLHPDERCPLIHREYQAPVKLIEDEIEKVEVLMENLEKAIEDDISPQA
tara:strand:- start:547 stop:1197 length:651 start_codon:yes stop_codon:yes gene_type:complete